MDVFGLPSWRIDSHCSLFLSFLSPTTNDSAGQIGLLCVFGVLGFVAWFVRVVRFATRLFQQSRTGQDNLVTDRLAHVVNGQGRDGRTRQGFHFDPYSGYIFPQQSSAHTAVRTNVTTTLHEPHHQHNRRMRLCIL